MICHSTPDWLLYCQRLWSNKFGLSVKPYKYKLTYEIYERIVWICVNEKREILREMIYHLEDKGTHNIRKLAQFQNTFKC